jgi:hypothetical protein
MTARVSMLLKSHASPDMFPFSLYNKKRLAIRHMNRPLFPTTLSIPSYEIGKYVGLRTYQHPLVQRVGWGLWVVLCKWSLNFRINRNILNGNWGAYRYRLYSWFCGKWMTVFFQRNLLILTVVIQVVFGKSGVCGRRLMFCLWRDKGHLSLSLLLSTQQHEPI